MSVKTDLTTTRAGAGLCHTPQAGSTVPGEENGTLIHRCFDEVVTRGDLAAAHEILTTDFVFYGPATGVHGPVNFVQSTGILRNALAVHFTVEVVIADGDRVSCLSTMQGTHQGNFGELHRAGGRSHCHASTPFTSLRPHPQITSIKS